MSHHLGSPPTRSHKLETSGKKCYWTAGPSTASHQLQADLLELQRLQYSARYGDYAKIIAHKVRKEATEQQTESWEEISDRLYCVELSEKLHEEAKDYDKYGAKSGPEQAGTSKAVHAAYTAVGIDFHQTRLAIYAYGERCDAVHHTIFTLVENDWSGAAHILYRDIQDLANVMPPGMEAQEETLRAILLELRDEWFDIQPDKFAEPKTWFPTQKVRREVRASRDPATRESNRVAHEEFVAKGAAKRLGKFEEED
ncbi:hypothetical protein MMC11_000895 [Xylographa trunciseda]|nr:hypothetical protein [Xylographa trunciseda]